MLSVKGPVVSCYQFLGHPLILEGANYASTAREGGYHAATMHTGARFHPCHCKETSVDHAHQHDHSYTDMDDVAT